VHLRLEESNNLVARLLSIENIYPMRRSRGNKYHPLKCRVLKGRKGL
jgi:hypothetical protein